MIKITYPAFNFKIKGEQNKELIFDEIRKQWVRLTPEEWVRQNMLQYMLQTLLYPAALIAVEKEIKLGELKKRCDMVVYKNGAPWMIIECKEANVTLSESTLHQILRYHLALPVPFLCLTNGQHVFLFENKDGHLQESTTFPAWTIPSDNTNI